MLSQEPFQVVKRFIENIHARRERQPQKAFRAERRSRDQRHPGLVENALRHVDVSAAIGFDWQWLRAYQGKRRMPPASSDSARRVFGLAAPRRDRVSP